MCAASPARKSRPCCIGSATKLRIAVTPFSRIGPSASVQPSSPRRSWSSSQIRVVRPLVDVLVGAALQVEARELGRAQAEQREAALVVRVDELVVDGATSARMPSQPNGYSRSNVRRTPAGMRRRQTPWKPSQPATTSHSSSLLRALVREARPRPLASRGRARSRPSTSKSSGRPGVEPRGDQVLDDLRLAVDDDRCARR